MTDKYPCVACGICCMNLDEQLFASIRLPNGACMHYDPVTKLCLIYESRPLLCRIDDYYDRHLAGVMDKERFYNMNIEACKNLMLIHDDQENYRKLTALVESRD